MGDSRQTALLLVDSLTVPAYMVPHATYIHRAAASATLVQP
jgi:hypothetical protein